MYFKECLGIVGWDAIEPVILIALAENAKICFVGNHGASKTSVCHRLAMALRKVEVKFQRYDCPNVKHDEIFGITNVKALTEGRYEFIQHPQTLWGKEVVLWSEINRTNPMLQSKLNEVLLEGTLHGSQTGVTWQFADANPSAKYEAYYLQPQVAARLFFVSVPNPTAAMFRDMIANEEAFDVFADLLECKDKDEAKKARSERNARIKAQVSPLTVFFHTIFLEEKVTEKDTKLAADVVDAAMRTMNEGSNGETFPLSMREAKRMFKMVARAGAYVRAAKLQPVGIMPIIENIVLGHIPNFHGLLAHSYDHASVVAAVRLVVTTHLEQNPQAVMLGNGDPINIITGMRRDGRFGTIERQHLRDVLVGRSHTELLRYAAFTIAKTRKTPDTEKVVRMVIEEIITSGMRLPAPQNTLWSPDNINKYIETFRENNK